MRLLSCPNHRFALNPQLGDGSLVDYDVTPDGKQFLMVQIDEAPQSRLQVG
jgi:hypothetical protein